MQWFGFFTKNVDSGKLATHCKIAERDHDAVSDADGAEFGGKQPDSMDIYSVGGRPREFRKPC